MNKWDMRFLQLATEVASWSKDKNKKVGCVLVNPNKCSFSFGYNGLPRNIEDSDTILNNRELKNRLIVHAELNAILNAPNSITGWTVYITEAPCIECAKSLIQANIGVIWVPNLNINSNWYQSQLCSINILKKSNILINFYSKQYLNRKTNES